MIGYLSKATMPLVLIMPKMSWYVKTFETKARDKDKNNKWMSFCIKDERLLEKYQAISTKFEDLKNIEMNNLTAYDDRNIKTTIRTYGNNVHTTFRGFNVPVDDIECESLTIISIDSLFEYERKYYLQVL